jgi:hypothetical protein
MSTQARRTRHRTYGIIAGLTATAIFGHSSVFAQSQPRPLTPEEERKLQKLPSQRTDKSNRTLRLKQGEKFQLGFFLDVLKIEFTDTKTIGAWPINSRTRRSAHGSQSLFDQRPG